MKTQAWHRTLGTLAAFPVAFYGVYFLMFNSDNIGYIFPILSFIIYLMLAVTISAGYHRLFTHTSYKCNKIWHWVYGVLGSASLSSSPIHWATVHTGHHRYSDTELDPYYTNWRYFFRFRNRTNLSIPKHCRRLFKDPMHVFFVNHSLSVFLTIAIIAGLMGPLYFLFLFALPVSLHLISAAIHTIFAHNKAGAQNYWFMEFIVPVGGDWIHKLHHENPSLSYWAVDFKFIDLGGYFINLIKVDDKQLT